jgi:hypothetical protein
MLYPYKFPRQWTYVAWEHDIHLLSILKYKIYIRVVQYRNMLLYFVPGITDSKYIKKFWYKYNFIFVTGFIFVVCPVMVKAARMI